MLRNPKAFSENARFTIVAKYLYKDPKTLEVKEKIEDFFPRVARAIAEVDKNVYGLNDEKVEKTYQKFLRVMDHHRVIPAGRTLANAGLDTPVVPNCVVLNMKDSLKSISETEMNARLLQQQGCGIGTCYDLRETGAVVSRARSTSSGPVSFLRVAQTGYATIQQQNRHGANMATLPVDHPDILEFITCKEVEGQIRNFNISVLLTDEFMERATNPNHPQYNDVWMCRYEGREMAPRLITRSNESYPKIESVDYTAKDIFDLIVDRAWSNGEPGTIFIDEVNRTNPLPGLGPIKASNPCVTKDTWVMTDKGPRMVKKLIERNDFKIHLGLKDKYSKLHSNGFFCSGRRDVYQIETREGFTIKCTDNHKLIDHRGNWVEVKDLNINDKLQLVPFEHDWSGEGNFNQGYLLGLLKGDGYMQKHTSCLTLYDSKQPGDVSHLDMKDIIDKIYNKEFGKNINWTLVSSKQGLQMSSVDINRLANKFGMFHKNKNVSNEIEMASKEFYIGFIRGFFDCDGSVQGSTKKGISVRLSQSSLNCLQKVQRMLLRLGIMSKIYHRQPESMVKMPTHDHRQSAFYKCKASYELIISRESILKYNDMIGFYHTKKMMRLNELIESFKRKPYVSKFICTISKISLIGQKKVYDVTTSNSKHAYQSNGMISANCGEQYLHDGDVCLLIGMNLSEYVNEKTSSVDWSMMIEDLKIAVHMGDNICDMYNVRVKKVMDAIKNNRRIGIGPMGFADMCLKLGVRYGSEQCLNLIGNIMSLWKRVTVEYSQKLALKRGVFQNWEKSIFFLNGEPIRRNAALTNAAPTGTISRIVDTSFGIEPIFKFAYKSKVLKTKMTTYHHLLKEQLEKLGLDNDPEIVQILRKSGSIQNIDKIPEEIRNIFVCAMDISVEDHINVQAEFQKYLDNSISKTINFPSEATREDVANAYIKAWKMKCKGCTVYRDTSRKEQVLESVDTGDTEKKLSTPSSSDLLLEKLQNHELIKTMNISAENLSQILSILKEDMITLNNINITQSSPASSSSSEPDEESSIITIGTKCLACKSPQVVHEEGCVRCLDCDHSPCAD